MELEQFLGAYNPTVQNLSFRLCALVSDSLPGAIQQVDAGSKIICFSFAHTSKSLICAIAPFAGQVHLIFAHGVDTADPDHLLEGTGKQARHIKITSVQQIDPKILRPYIVDGARKTTY